MALPLWNAGDKSLLGLLLLGMALVPLAPCLPAWKPQALETWLNAGSRSHFCFLYT